MQCILIYRVHEAIKPPSLNLQEKDIPDYAKPTIANKMKDR